MSDNLRHALDDLVRHTAAETTARTHDGHGLDAHAVSTRARHGRRRRTAITTVTGLATAAALVFAGFDIADRRTGDPLPAAPSPSSTSTPAPSQTVRTTLLPTADPSLPFGECGALVTAPPEHPVSDRWAVDVSVASVGVAATDGLGVTAVLRPLDQAEDVVGLTRGAGPVLAVARDDVVVASGDLYGSKPSVLDYLVNNEGGTWATRYVGAVGLRSCVPGATDHGGDGENGTLPPGDYVLYAVVPVMALTDDFAIIGDGSPETLQGLVDARPDEWRAALSDPVPFTITAGASVTPAPAVAEAVTPAPLAPSPVCGEASPRSPIAGDRFVLDLTAAPTRLAQGGSVQVPADLTYVGPGRIGVSLTYGTEFWAVRDGVVVGGSMLTPQDGTFERLDIGTGLTDPRPGPLELWACDGTSAAERPLGPGVYTVYPALEMEILRTSTDVGITVAGLHSDTGAVFGQPFTLTIE